MDTFGLVCNKVFLYIVCFALMFTKVFSLFVQMSLRLSIFLLQFRLSREEGDRILKLNFKKYCIWVFSLFPALWGFLHLKSELIRRKGMQISVIIASNFHPEKFIILISLSNNIMPKSKEKYNLKKKSCFIY